MSKQLQLHDLQIQAILGGARSFIVPIDVRTDITKQAWLDSLIADYSPLQVGDEFEVDEWIEEHGGMDYGGSNPIHHKFTITSVEVKRVQELRLTEYAKCGLWVDDNIAYWYNSQHGENAYEQNGNVFLISFEMKG